MYPFFLFFFLLSLWSFIPKEHDFFVRTRDPTWLINSDWRPSLLTGRIRGNMLQEKEFLARKFSNHPKIINMKAPELTRWLQLCCELQGYRDQSHSTQGSYRHYEKRNKVRDDSAQITYRACVTVGLGTKVNTAPETEHYDLSKLLQQHFK